MNFYISYISKERNVNTKHAKILSAFGGGFFHFLTNNTN